MDKMESPDLLESMVGKIVRVFKGGPESRKGKVLAVTPDYLVLHTKEDGVVYYQSYHIKSVIENARENTEISNDYDTGVEFIDAFDFNELLVRLKNKFITIDRGGPESRTGLLVNVYRDFMVLRTYDEGDLYYQIQHIKSISERTNGNTNENDNEKEKDRDKEKDKDKDKENEKEREKDKNKEEKEHQVFAVKTDLKGVQNFSNLLDTLQYRWVKVNRGGPETIEGILVDNQDETLVIVSHHDIDWISTYHIRNISLVTEKRNDSDENKNENKNSQNKNENRNNKKNRNKNNSGGNKNNSNKKGNKNNGNTKGNKNNKENRNKKSTSRSKGNKKQNRSKSSKSKKSYSQSQPVKIRN